MRLGCDWFVRRASKIWSVQHGRSFLVLVPQGCNDEAAAKLVNSWCLENFRPPVAFFDHQPLWISIVSDSQLTSHQVATRIARQINRQCGDDLGTDLDDYPSNIIQGAVDAALSHKRYPILFVRRFHAFASIQDGGMSSVLSQLRSLEMEGCLTTIAFSPMTYAAIRKSVDGSQAFLNSVYGDAHDLAVADPVSRAEFVSYAMSLGVVEQAAQRLFLYGGGPDKVFESLAHALVINEPDPVSYSVNQCSDVIEAFFERTLSEAGASMGSLLSALSVGKLDMSEEAFLKSNPMHNFFAKTDGVGRLVCNAAILTRWIWSNRAGRWSGYAGCLSFLRNGGVACSYQACE
ncbi:hypothetical protein ABFU27_00670 [Xanthomonas campestris pv. raphani]|uniref:hypothetical protein n=1 Tax=Xanthomonas campestris TaxID=339 RepID=UPI00388EE55D